MATSGRFSQIQAPVKIVHSNLDQEIIQVTEDKLRLALNQHLSQAEQRKSWVAPLGILVAIVLAFATSSFKDALFLTAATWAAIFLIAGLLSVVWLVVALIRAVKSPSVEDVVDMIKNRSNRD